MSKVLITGFEPFDGFNTNPSAEVAKALNGKKIGSAEVKGIVLPLDYTKAFEILKKHIETHKPSILLSCGQANRASITIERIAINAQSVTKEDNYGNMPSSDVIVEDGPAAYFSNIDPHPLVERLRNEEIPAYVSYHAGTYGCNWLLFKIIDMITKKNIELKTTFIHLPPLPVQSLEKNLVNLATMLLTTEVRALEIMIESLTSSL